ncbi:MAG: trehalose-6-phosphate synthase [Candidatus Eisenbacteria bacterium]
MQFSHRVRSALGRAAVRTQQRHQGPPRTTRETLVEWARAHLRGRELVVVSNREPYSHQRDPEGIRWVRNAGGVTVALDAVMQSLGGVWVAHGSGDADSVTVDADDRVACPPDHPSYHLRRVWLSAEDHERYYSGFSNGALWPLCHIAYVRPRFRTEDWERYRDVNRRFAHAVLEEVGDRPALVFVQDYHLALVAAELKKWRPDLHVAMFWHIPWPNPEVFRIMPWGAEVLEGMLASDLLGFHIHAHALNFIDSVRETLEARCDTGQLAIERSGRRTWVRHFPISVNAEEIAVMAESPATQAAVEELRQRLGLEGCAVGLGVDRMDYTKGIPERLEAVERLFETCPEWIGRFVFIQIGVPSRVELSEYRAVRHRMRSLATRINRRFGGPRRPAVHVIETALDFRELVPYYRLADLCAVTSLHDGMNLVAKEYIAARTGLDGALVLSPFTGAARELERAFIASPYDVDALAATYHAALSASPDSRRERLAALRETVLRRNIFDWAIEVFDTALRLDLITPVAGVPTAPGS